MLALLLYSLLLVLLGAALTVLALSGRGDW